MAEEKKLEKPIVEEDCQSTDTLSPLQFWLPQTLFYSVMVSSSSSSSSLDFESLRFSLLDLYSHRTCTTISELIQWLKVIYRIALVNEEKIVVLSV